MSALISTGLNELLRHRWRVVAVATRTKRTLMVVAGGRNNCHARFKQLLHLLCNQVGSSRVGLQA